MFYYKFKDGGIMSCLSENTSKDLIPISEKEFYQEKEARDNKRDEARTLAMEDKIAEALENLQDLVTEYKIRDMSKFTQFAMKNPVLLDDSFGITEEKITKLFDAGIVPASKFLDKMFRKGWLDESKLVQAMEV